MFSTSKEVRSNSVLELKEQRLGRRITLNGQEQGVKISQYLPSRNSWQSKKRTV